MYVRIRLALVAAVWIASLVAVGTLVRAQTRTTPIPSPVVLSGADIGFRVTGMTGNTPTGNVVIRINGQWIVPKFGGGDALLAP
jgi:hypothetical protein